VWKNTTEFKLHDVVVKVNGLDENTTYHFRAPIEEKVGKMKVENLKHGTFTTQQCKQNGKLLLIFLALGNGKLRTDNSTITLSTDNRLVRRSEDTELCPILTFSVKFPNGTFSTPIQFNEDHSEMIKELKKDGDKLIFKLFDKHGEFAYTHSPDVTLGEFFNI